MNTLLRSFWRRAAALTSGAVSLMAGEAGEKAAYTLSNPVPTALLRELSTDRPDATESPFTVDAGHVQVEMDIVNFARDKSGEGEWRSWTVLPFNVRVGVTQRTEVGLFAALWNRTQAKPGRTQTGWGDVTLRGKFNWQGNDTDETGFGGIVDVKVPTARKELSNGRWEGAFFLPVATELAKDWEFGAMTGGEWRYADSDGYRPVWVNSVVVGRSVTRQVSAYVEFTSEVGDGGAANTFDAGLSWRIGNNTQFDVGAETGLTHHADDLVVFVGVARRY